MSHAYYNLPPWHFMPPPNTRPRRRKAYMPPPDSIDDMIDSHRKWQAYLEELKKSEKKDDKPKGFEKFQQVCAHWGYLVVVGIPVGFATLGAYHLILKGVATAVGMK